jgi:hypothetical protein
VDVLEAALAWKRVWERAWPAQDVEAIAALYSTEATYRALAFREPDVGTAGVRDYLRRNFEAEHDITCRFGEPVASDSRAAIEWWASWIEDGEPLTLAGVTLLRFDHDGLIVDHRDYWNEISRREHPYSGW